MSKNVNHKGKYSHKGQKTLEDRSKHWKHGKSSGKK